MTQLLSLHNYKGIKNYRQKLKIFLKKYKNYYKNYKNQKAIMETILQNYKTYKKIKIKTIKE